MVDDKVRHVEIFWKAKGLRIPTLLDLDGGVFDTVFRNPGLPSTVILDPAGRVVAYHTSTVPLETLQQEILEALAAPRPVMEQEP